MKELSLIYNHGSSKINQLIKEPALRTIISLSFDENPSILWRVSKHHYQSLFISGNFPQKKKNLEENQRFFIIKILNIWKKIKPA